MGQGGGGERDGSHHAGTDLWRLAARCLQHTGKHTHRVYARLPMQVGYGEALQNPVTR